ncbi:nucleotidyl transferase AbiEii/AbiGii toxin family protein [Kistimonas scapharcae]|uniref:Nucleotidyl transferase AbiEii/AbiGii toxin family protein n=1 Tax=Kistimonas scapharcae TaxID=1036133 RepID=A0ABP8V2U7_9GAMM
MKMTNDDFAQLVERIMQNDTLSYMRPVVEKELLHYDILYCLDQAGLLDHLVFQGGTSLRLCHGGNRFSEDLDFAGGVDFSSASLANMKACIEDYIGARYGLQVSVKEPASLKKDPVYAEMKIDKWQISVVTAPDRKDIPRQKIKIEVANVPAYTREALPLRVNYRFLPDGYGDTLVFTETLNEVMADKLISLPATQNYIRYRDIWDLPWLQQQGAKVNAELVKKKIVDYKLDDFDERLVLLIQNIPAMVTDGALKKEMRRFLPNDVYERTLGKEKFESFLVGSLQTLFEGLKKEFYGGDASPDFIM